MFPRTKPAPLPRIRIPTPQSQTLYHDLKAFFSKPVPENGRGLFSSVIPAPDSGDGTFFYLDPSKMTEDDSSSLNSLPGASSPTCYPWELAHFRHDLFDHHLQLWAIDLYDFGLDTFREIPLPAMLLVEDCLQVEVQSSFVVMTGQAEVMGLVSLDVLHKELRATYILQILETMRELKERERKAARKEEAVKRPASKLMMRMTYSRRSGDWFGEGTGSTPTASTSRAPAEDVQIADDLSYGFIPPHVDEPDAGHAEEADVAPDVEFQLREAYTRITTHQQPTNKPYKSASDSSSSSSSYSYPSVFTTWRRARRTVRNVGDRFFSKLRFLMPHLGRHHSFPPTHPPQAPPIARPVVGGSESMHSQPPSYRTNPSVELPEYDNISQKPPSYYSHNSPDRSNRHVSFDALPVPERTRPFVVVVYDNQGIQRGASSSSGSRRPHNRHRSPSPARRS
ncbi:hypothetical protein DFH27DRAFT_529446 [Peziza echinospora]|nr:hypothetical protein DFH27DRAFT_529446 [Peziza echinospora]